MYNAGCVFLLVAPTTFHWPSHNLVISVLLDILRHEGLLFLVLEGCWEPGKQNLKK